MARYPGATWRPVDRYQSGPLRVPMKPRRFVVHTAVSNATPSMHSFFNVAGRATPHFYVGRDGSVEQYIDTDFRGSANLDGNVDCIGVETWDGFPASWNGHDPGPRFTDAQAESLARLMAWVNRRHEIPLRWVRSSRAGTTGIATHRDGCDGNFPTSRDILKGRRPGGQKWSLSAGKICPTNVRIIQTFDEIADHAREIVARRAAAPEDNVANQNRAEQALHLLHQAIDDMKPSRRRDLLRRAAKLIRKATAQGVQS